MPARGDFRIRQVARNANVSLRTARRWRDGHDPRWERYLTNNGPSYFDTLTVPPIAIPTVPEMDGFDLINHNTDDGHFIPPKTFTKQNAVDALEHLRALTFRLACTLGADPAPFPGIKTKDYEGLCPCYQKFKKLAEHYNGGPLENPTKV